MTNCSFCEKAVQCFIEPNSACRESISHGLQLHERPLIAMPEKGLLAIVCGSRFSVNEVIPRADKSAKVGCRTFQVDLLCRVLEALHQM